MKRDQASPAGTEPPRAHLVEGRMRQLELFLGMHPRWTRLSAARRKPSIVGRIGIVPARDHRQICDFNRKVTHQ